MAALFFTILGAKAPRKSSAGLLVVRWVTRAYRNICESIWRALRAVSVAPRFSMRCRLLSRSNDVSVSMGLEPSHGIRSFSNKAKRFLAVASAHEGNCLAYHSWAIAPKLSAPLWETLTAFLV